MDFCRPPLWFWISVHFWAWSPVFRSIFSFKIMEKDFSCELQFLRSGLFVSMSSHGFRTIFTRRPSVHSLGLLVVFQRKGPCGDCSSGLPDYLYARSYWLPDYICRPATLNFRTICRPATLDFRTICRPVSRFWTTCSTANTEVRKWSSFRPEVFGLIVPG